MDRTTYLQLRDALASRQRRIVTYNGRSARTLTDLEFIARANGFDPLADVIEPDPATDSDVIEPDPATDSDVIEPDPATAPARDVEAERAAIMAMSHKELGHELRAAKAQPIPATTVERRIALLAAKGLLDRGQE